MTCPECELNKARAALWRHEAYKQGGTSLPWDVDEVIAKAVAAEREACAELVENFAVDREDEYVCNKAAAAIRSRNA